MEMIKVSNVRKVFKFNRSSGKNFYQRGQGRTINPTVENALSLLALQECGVLLF